MAVLRTTRQTVTGYGQKWWYSNQYLSSEHPLAMLYQRLIKGQRLARRPRSQDMQTSDDGGAFAKIYGRTPLPVHLHRAELVNSLLEVSFSRIQHGRWKVRLIGGIGIMLRFQCNSAMVRIISADTFDRSV